MLRHLRVVKKVLLHRHSCLEDCLALQNLSRPTLAVAERYYSLVDCLALLRAVGVHRWVLHSVRLSLEQVAVYSALVLEGQVLRVASV